MTDRLTREEVRALIGRSDDRVVTEVLNIGASQAELAEIATAAGKASGAGDLEKISFELQVDLSHYDEEFAVTEPQGAKPMDELLHGIFGG